MPFTNFTTHKVTVKSEALQDDVVIHCLKGGNGPPLLLLHGYPQTYLMWHEIADELSSRFTVIASDLRGYGQSSKPPGSESHVEYSKREMAADQVAVMKHFGFSEFFLIGHDRGARVSHRMAVDHPGAVKKMLLLDIAPTLKMYETTNMMFATGYWHWFFHIIPSPHPENIIMGDPSAYWGALFSRLTHNTVVQSAEATKHYQSAFFNRDTVHATCEDYRAAASIDLEHDREDLANNRKISTPKVRILWGKKGMIERYDDPLGLWREVCHEDRVKVTGKGLDSGHFIPEELPVELLDDILEFMH